MKIKITYLSSVIIILLSLILVCFPASSAENLKKVAVLPFTMNSDRDLSFLQKGIMDMLNSRLSWQDKVKAMEYQTVKKKADKFGGPIDKEAALQIGRDLKADYVVMGSLTVFGQSVSIDARILEVSKGKELVTAFNQSKGMDDVIPTVNKFAQDINAKIMGRYVRPPVYAMKQETEKKRAGLIKVQDKMEAGDADYVQNFKSGIMSLDAGDVDGDGKNELVFIDSRTVYVYKWTENTFALFKSIKGGITSDYVYVSVADMDGDGRAEIYVSNLTDARLSSFVLEWQGSTFVSICKREPWFMRVTDIPGKGQSLIGQERIVGKGFSHTVYLLKREGSRISKAEPLDHLPHMANVFNFVQGKITSSGNDTIVLSPETEYLFMFDSEGNEIWRSEEEFGGSDIYMTVPGSAPAEEKWIHLSSPIVLWDIDKDGRDEVVICQNKSSVRRMLEKERFFTSGIVHFLRWDKVNLSTKLKTKKMGGPVSAYVIKDVDNDDKPELVMSVAGRPSGKWKLLRRKTNRAQIVVYELD
jgi:TolB-like protein